LQTVSAQKFSRPLLSGSSRRLFFGWGQKKAAGSVGGGEFSAPFPE